MNQVPTTSLDLPEKQNRQVKADHVGSEKKKKNSKLVMVSRLEEVDAVIAYKINNAVFLSEAP